MSWVAVPIKVSPTPCAGCRRGCRSAGREAADAQRSSCNPGDRAGLGSSHGEADLLLTYCSCDEICVCESCSIRFPLRLPKKSSWCPQEPSRYPRNS